MEKTVLITGATGFLGSHLVHHYLDAGYRVAILKRSFSSCDRLQAALSRVESYDVDQMGIGKIFQQVGAVDAIVHTATSYGRKGESVQTIFDTNTMFPLRFLQAAMQAGTKLFLNTDTSLDRTLNSYALSKAQFRDWGELLSRSADHFGFINIRLEHMVGPGDDESKFVTFLIQNCLRQVETLALTPGEQQRDFVHIDDVVSGYQHLLAQGLAQEWTGFHDYALGSGEGVRIRDLAEQVKTLTRSPTELQFGARPYRPHEVMYSVADIAPLRDLGWQPQYSAAQAIAQTVAAYLPAAAAVPDNHQNVSGEPT